MKNKDKTIKTINVYIFGLMHMIIILAIISIADYYLFGVVISDIGRALIGLFAVYIYGTGNYRRKIIREFEI